MKISLLLSLIVFSLAFAPGLHAQSGQTSGIIMTEAPPPPPPLPDKTRFNGTIINTGGKYYLGGRFTMEIERWSTDEEVAEMKKRLAAGGQDLVLEQVWKAKQIGYISISGSMGKPLFFARALPVPGGWVVRALTNAPISHFGPVSEHYPLGYIEFMLPSDGKDGHGQLIAMANVGFDSAGAVQVTAYGMLPVKLEDVEISQPKKPKKEKK